MHILIVLAHPDKHSFNHAIAAQAAATLKHNGHAVILYDLYAEGFDPNLPAHEIPRNATLPDPIDNHCKQTAQADGIIIVHPNWWGMPPAILAGWVDRIMRPGVAYEFVEGDSGEGVPVGLLKADKAIIFNTSNTSAQREKTIFGDPLERIWKNCIFDLCGVGDITRHMFQIIVTSSHEERLQWLEEVATIVTDKFPPRA
ncbi:MULTISPECIES: NAD(P)H-dependent oxidoreductase [unclassified Pseudodesulfovibrio]|uniref:NAD(P)H-dependent oxidoreductase n=1 Tax=unclassified Pseudodesulfovibrio TaxID=2661612 RepID=UPI000FEBB60C|nr:MULTISPECIES: NAD(P)H-dependent oxidoreductase [unclassified Pseudodesulfovibrio]MCJ2163791.1 NAD(P)H-dependent oxidoreductase [Pseudodesulfovibrio sp. S3-i]RWU05961.1 flavodoxin family protein [Pseudodesulfovibrio sp. S3]